ncbi:DUF503 domain-containing protein [Gordonia sp. (in: high G+C Gram-positive bacteria)]|uniref:DUF503 domain-containing protein n=1 Tax=Gordonia sp. (in: high G+C Gram-positive bacteria) TaxID=84139 RepID=UPI003F9EB1A1
MWIGTLELDFLLGDVHSLKEKRSVVRPIVAEIHRRFSVSVAETGHRELYRRAGVGLSVVSADAAHVTELLDAVEWHAAARPEVTLLSARRRLVSSEDLE